MQKFEHVSGAPVVGAPRITHAQPWPMAFNDIQLASTLCALNGRAPPANGGSDEFKAFNGMANSILMLGTQNAEYVESDVFCNVLLHWPRKMTKQVEGVIAQRIMFYNAKGARTRHSSLPLA